MALNEYGEGGSTSGGNGGSSVNYEGNNILYGSAYHDWVYGMGGNDHLYGGNGDDHLYGGADNDKLYGGAGADYMDGGTGWDTASYWEATAAVQVYMNFSAPNQGDAAGDQLANIECVDGSRFNDVLVGDAGANAFWGDNGHDIISGGAGNDTLGGGSGADSFRFTTALGASNVDTINDFTLTTYQNGYELVPGDRIVLSRSVFKDIREHELGISDASFTNGSVLTTSAHRIVYNKATGELFYDPDGNGMAARVKFAVLANKPQDLDFSYFAMTL